MDVNTLLKAAQFIEKSEEIARSVQHKNENDSDKSEPNANVGVFQHWRKKKIAMCCEKNDYSTSNDDFKPSESVSATSLDHSIIPVSPKLPHKKLNLSINVAEQEDSSTSNEMDCSNKACSSSGDSNIDQVDEENDQLMKLDSNSEAYRAAHNRLEKHRRAELKTLFVKLQSLIPSIRSKRATNGKILCEAYKCIQVLKQAEEEKKQVRKRLLQRKSFNIIKIQQLRRNLLKNLPNEKVRELLRAKEPNFETVNWSELSNKPVKKNDGKRTLEQETPESFLSELKRIKERRDSLTCVRSSTPPPPSNITPFFPRFSLPGGGSPPLLNSQTSGSSSDDNQDLQYSGNRVLETPICSSSYSPQPTKNPLLNSQQSQMNLPTRGPGKTLTISGGQVNNAHSFCNDSRAPYNRATTSSKFSTNSMQKVSNAIESKILASNIPCTFYIPPHTPKTNQQILQQQIKLPSSVTTSQIQESIRMDVPKRS